VGEIANSFGQDPQERKSCLKSALRVVWVEVFTDRDATDGLAPVTELSQAALREQVTEEGRTRSRQRWKIKVTAHDVPDRGLEGFGQLRGANNY